MYECESWTVRKAEHWRIDAFELWCWRRLLRVPRTARRSNQCILKYISPGCSLFSTDAEAETLILWPPHGKSWLIGKDPDAGRDWGQEEKGTTEDEMSDGITDLMDMSWVNSGNWCWTGRPVVLWFMGSQKVAHDLTTELKLKLNWKSLHYNWSVIVLFESKTVIILWCTL